MAIVSGQLAESLQALVDARLDTIDRMLVGRVPRSDRAAIVREVESQIFELLQGRDSDDLDRDDVLAVLGRLDPPEAYLPDEEGRVDRAVPRVPTGPAASRRTPRAAKAGGVLGIVAVVFMLLIPVSYVAAEMRGSMAVFVILGGGSALGAAAAALTALMLSAYAAFKGPWALAGAITGGLALLFTAGVIGVCVIMATG